jgi:hypothetical protein
MRPARSLSLPPIGAIVAAIFSGWQAWIASDNEERQLRAYVIIGAFKKVENFDARAKPRVIVTLENVGQTPVYDATWLSGIDPVTYPFAKGAPAPVFLECSEIMTRADTRRWFFGKRHDVNKEAVNPLTDAEMTGLKAGNAQSPLLAAFATAIYSIKCGAQIFACIGIGKMTALAMPTFAKRETAAITESATAQRPAVTKSSLILSALSATRAHRLKHRI